MSVLVAAQTGQTVTVAELLGEKGQSEQERKREVIRSQRKMEKRLRKKGIGAGEMIQVSGTVQPFLG